MPVPEILRQLPFTIQRAHNQIIIPRTFCNSCSLLKTCRQIQRNTLWCKRKLHGHTSDHHDKIRFGQIMPITLSLWSRQDLGWDDRLLQQTRIGNSDFNRLPATIKHGILISRCCIENLEPCFWFFKDS